MSVLLVSSAASASVHFAAALLLYSYVHLQYKVLEFYFTCLLLFNLFVPVALIYVSDHCQLLTWPLSAVVCVSDVNVISLYKQKEERQL